ncbi:MAG: hypothetical protein K8I27_04655 [Planctomycetes bacterium]|nr:hypothetical protein [Planctomycetota bacterium]
MTALQQQIARFRVRLMLRIAAYSAMIGLLIALVLVIAAPWLRDELGLPGYWATLSLPLVIPAIYVALAIFKRPSERESVLAADAWSGGEGSIISAWELEKENPDSPFVRPVALHAVERLSRRRLPEPRLLRKLMVALVVLFLLVPLSRYVHAEMQKAQQEEQAEEQARKVDVPSEIAEELAKDAGAAAEKAKENKAEQQERLADDIEQAARNAQAGGQDKERALREANSLVDRARAQTESSDAREEARQALENNEITRDLSEAIDNADADKVNEEVKELAEQVYRPDGSVDQQAAERLKQAIEEAQRAAPQDARLRRAAEDLGRMLDEKTLDNAEKRRKETQSRLEGEGLDAETIADALEKLGQMDKRALERALEEMSKSSSPLRDMDVSGREMEELLKQLEGGEISPEDARRMAEAAKQLSERLELDAETLRELLQRGKDFEGLDDAAKRMGEGEAPAGPEQVPEWARDMIPPEWEQAWKDAAQSKGGGAREGEGNGEGEGRGKGKGEGNPDKDLGRKVDGEGIKEGVDTVDTGEGEKDPDKDPERLDTDKAKEEEARRNKTGRDGTSSGINTRDEEERLPRRYRDAARKYFERD